MGHICSCQSLWFLVHFLKAPAAEIRRLHMFINFPCSACVFLLVTEESLEMWNVSYKLSQTSKLNQIQNLRPAKRDILEQSCGKRDQSLDSQVIPRTAEEHPHKKLTQYCSSNKFFLSKSIDPIFSYQSLSLSIILCTERFCHRCLSQAGFSKRVLSKFSHLGGWWRIKLQSFCPCSFLRSLRRSNTSKLFSKKIKFNITKKYTSDCPESLPIFPALEMFKVRPDRAWCNLF